MFVVGGLNSIKHAPEMAPKAKPITDKIVETVRRAAPQVPIPEDAATLVRANGAMHVAGALLLATGHFPRATSLVLAGSLVPTTLAGHRFWEESDPGMRQNQKVHFFKNVSMAGGLLMASLDPDPHKKILPRRAKDRASQAVGNIRS